MNANQVIEQCLGHAFGSWWAENAAQLSRYNH